MSGAFGIAQNSKNIGLEARDLRKIIEGSYSSTGIITGGAVRGNQNLTYHIDDTVGLSSRGSSDGMSLFYLKSTDTRKVSAGSSLSRIDTIWVKVHDPELDNDEYGVTVEVTEGVPSQLPVAPEIDPTGTRIIDMLVAPNTTNLATGATVNGSYDFSIPYGSSLGLLGMVEDTRKDSSADSTIRKWTIELPVRFYVPTDRVIELIYNADVSFADAPAGAWLSWASEFELDGKRVLYSARETYSSDGVWVHSNNSKIITVTKGSHIARVKNGVASKSSDTGYPHFHYGEEGELSYPGKSLQVWDRGVAR